MTFFVEKNTASSSLTPGPNGVKFQKQLIEDKLLTLSTIFGHFFHQKADKPPSL
jgi:hypothetical protein